MVGGRRLCAVPMSSRPSFVGGQGY
uniref:Uncharacterized protein n=1 Tax=Rhizophora mucronata TaxID=61149 RepID=A0A2P2IKW7_RHIMU